MSITLNTKVYSRVRFNTPDSVTYGSTDNSYGSKDTLELKRVYPKPTATFGGVARPTFKLVTAEDVDGVSVDNITTLTGSYPAGSDGAVRLEQLTRMKDMLALEIAATTNVASKLAIEY